MFTCWNKELNKFDFTVAGALGREVEVLPLDKLEVLYLECAGFLAVGLGKEIGFTEVVFTEDIEMQGTSEV